jgi:hypothetical protein
MVGRCRSGGTVESWSHPPGSKVRNRCRGSIPSIRWRVCCSFSGAGTRSLGWYRTFSTNLVGRLSRILGFILPSRRPATPLDRRHPCGRAPAASTVTCSQTFKGHDRFLDLFSLLAQFGKHFRKVHIVPRIAPAPAPRRARRALRGRRSPSSNGPRATFASASASHRP